MGTQVLFKFSDKIYHANMTGDLYKSVKTCRKSLHSKGFYLQTEKSHLSGENKEKDREKRYNLPNYSAIFIRNQYQILGMFHLHRCLDIEKPVRKKIKLRK